MSKTSLQVSKRVKGFAVALSRQHWFMVHQIYPWLREAGLTTEETDEALTLFPNWTFSKKALAAGEHGGEYGADAHGIDWSGLGKGKTIRVRAEHLAGMAKLLRLVGAFYPSGQMKYTLHRRAHALESISTLDQLADAGR